MATSVSEPPMRKRTRRACDQCRRRKTKCDGALICKTCVDVGLQCSYGDHLRQAHGLAYVVHLEKKLRDFEEQASKTSASSLVSEKNGVASLNRQTSSLNGLGSAPAQVISGTSTATIDWESIEAIGTPPSCADDVIKTIDYTLEDESPNCDNSGSIYRGKSSGIEIVCNLRRICSSFVRFTLDLDSSATTMANALDAPLPIHHLSLNSITNVCFLSEPQVYRWINIAFVEAFTLWPFIDRQLFNVHVKRLLGQNKCDRDRLVGDYLGLIHAIIALGQRHDPDLANFCGTYFRSRDYPGIEHFGAARDLVGLNKCSRSIIAIQTALCMCLYMNSVNAHRMAHTYVSMAGSAAYDNPQRDHQEPDSLVMATIFRVKIQLSSSLLAMTKLHQLGLHMAADNCHLPEKDRVTRQRTYNTLRTLDAYVTSSLGLPRHLRDIRPIRHPTPSPSTDCSERLLAADANLELLDILGITLENVYFTNATSGNLDEHRKVGGELEAWARRHTIFTQITDENLTSCTKSQLFLRYSKCFVVLVLYYPFLHDVAKAQGDRNLYAFSCGAKCIEAAIQAVHTAEVLESQDALNKTYAPSVDVLAMAAMTLLMVELGAPIYVEANIVGRASRIAKTLLESLAQKNRTAAQCLESLRPLYQSIIYTTPPVPAEHGTRDYSQFPTMASNVPVLNSWLQPVNSNPLLGRVQDAGTHGFGYSTGWPFLSRSDFVAPNVAPSRWQ